MYWTCDRDLTSERAIPMTLTCRDYGLDNVIVSETTARIVNKQKNTIKNNNNNIDFIIIIYTAAVCARCRMHYTLKHHDSDTAACLNIIIVLFFHRYTRVCHESLGLTRNAFPEARLNSHHQPLPFSSTITHNAQWANGMLHWKSKYFPIDLHTLNIRNHTKKKNN